MWSNPNDPRQWMLAYFAQQMLYNMKANAAAYQPPDTSGCDHIWRVRSGKLVCDLCDKEKTFR